MISRIFLCLFFLYSCNKEAIADIVLLLSDDKPSITSISDSLINLYPEKVEVYNLFGDPKLIPKISASISASPTVQVVAIGLLAAQVARQRLKNKQTIFCQVLNYQSFDLISAHSKGVSAIPSLVKQFKFWKQLNPNLNKVGVITSHAMTDLVEAGKTAALNSNITITHGLASSDRELPFILRELEGIQGLWLAPDSSVLSINAINDIMSEAIKKNIQVLSFAPALLQRGALLSATTNKDDVAKTVLLRLKQAKGQREIPGVAVMELNDVDFSVNEIAVKQFNLSISNELRELLHGQKIN